MFNYVPNNLEGINVEYLKYKDNYQDQMNLYGQMQQASYNPYQQQMENYDMYNYGYQQNTCNPYLQYQQQTQYDYNQYQNTCNPYLQYQQQMNGYQQPQYDYNQYQQQMANYDTYNYAYQQTQYDYNQYQQPQVKTNPFQQYEMQAQQQANTYTDDIELEGINYNSPTIQDIIKNHQRKRNAQIEVPGYQQPVYENNLVRGVQNNDGNSYYGNMNNPYMNNYQSFKEMLKAQQEQLQNEIEIRKMRLRIYYTYKGIEFTEDDLDRICNPNSEENIAKQKEFQEEQEHARIVRICNDPAHLVQPNYALIARQKAHSDEIRRRHPVNQSFTDFMNTAGEDYANIIFKEQRRQRVKHDANTFFNSEFFDLSLAQNIYDYKEKSQEIFDSHRIAPPPGLSDPEVVQRRKEFFNNIFSNNSKHRISVEEMMETKKRIEEYDKMDKKDFSRRFFEMMRTGPKFEEPDIQDEYV